MATKKYLDQQGLQTLINGLKAKNDALYAAAGHAHAASEISYKNANIKGGADIKVDEALNVLVANVVRATEDLSTTDGNVKELEKAINALKDQIGEGTVADKIQAVQTALDNFKTDQATKDQGQDTAIEAAQQAADDAATAVETEKSRAQSIEQGLQSAIDGMKDPQNGILAQAKAYAEQKDEELHTAISAEIDEDVKVVADNLTAEISRAQAAEKVNADKLVVIQGEGEGSIKKALADAKTYADGKDAAIAAAKKAGDDAQADVDALAGKVGTVAEGETVVGLIADAKKAGTDAAAAVATEKGRAESIEQGLRDDLGQASDPAAAEGSAFARIAQVKADLASEVTRAKAAEKEAKDAAVAAQGDVDALEAKVGVVPADKTVVQMIADAKTEATYDDTDLKNRVATIEGDYLKAADKTELQGKIDTVSGVANAAKEKIDAFMAAADVQEGAIDTLKELQEYITTHGQAAATMTNNIAANAQAIKDETARAQKAEKANADAIDKLNGADTEEGSVAKAVKDAKDAVMTEVNKKVAQADYDTKVAELAATDAANLKDAKAYADQEDAKIEAILGHKAIEGGEAATGLCADVAANAAAIAAEATARQAADTALDGRLDTIEGEGEGSIKKALADAKKYTDDQIDTMALTNDEIDAILNTVYGIQA